MLNSDKKNKYSNSCVVRKKFLNETKNHNPPPPFKLNGRSLINVIYVVKCLVEILIYKITLEYMCILVINLINVMVKDLIRILTYRHTLEHILVINLNNIYVW